MSKQANGSIIATALLLWSTPADSCSCISSDIARQVRNADFIFKGTVSARRQIQAESFGLNGAAMVRFRVERSYKGKMQGHWIEVKVPYGGSECGYNFKSGKTYLVFANQQQSVAGILAPFINIPATNICLGNRLFSAHVEEYLLHAAMPPFMR
jgi:hypothetical protein